MFKNFNDLTTLEQFGIIIAGGGCAIYTIITLINIVGGLMWMF